MAVAGLLAVVDHPGEGSIDIVVEQIAEAVPVALGEGLDDDFKGPHGAVEKILAGKAAVGGLDLGEAGGESRIILP